MDNLKKIAIIRTMNYSRKSRRYGLLWEFDASCKRNNIQVGLVFFRISVDHGDLNKFYHYGNQNIFFLDFNTQTNPVYSHVINHL
jgi:hypothetical protein